MQAPPRTVNAGKAIFQQALIFGLLMFSVRLLIFVLNYFTPILMYLPFRFAGLIFTIISALFFTIVALFVFFLAGLFAAKRTGKMGSGALAGLLGGLFYGILCISLEITVFFTLTLPNFTRSDPTRVFPPTILASIFASVIAVDLFIVGLGAGSLGGLFGGLAGRQQPPRRYYFPPASTQFPYQQHAYTPPMPQQPQGLQCMSCRQWNKPDDLYCSLCGKPLVPEKQHCSNCKAELRPGATFCTKCGTTKQQPAQQQTGAEQHPFPQQEGTLQQPNRLQMDIQQQPFPQQTGIQQPTGQPER